MIGLAIVCGLLPLLYILQASIDAHLELDHCPECAKVLRCELDCSRSPESIIVRELEQEMA